MKLEDQQELCFGIAYWKKRWVGVPLFHSPDASDSKTRGSSLMQRRNKALEQHMVSVKETIVPWLWSEKDLKKLCRDNDLPIRWVTDRFPRKGRNKITRVTRREDRKIRSLTSAEFRQIRQELVKMNKQVALVVGILWYFNSVLGKDGAFITLEEIIRLQVQDVSPEQADGSNWIRLMRTGTYCHLVVLPLPLSLWRSLSRQINENSAFVFSTKNGGPLLPVQIDGYLKKAAKIAGFKDPITSVSLRPSFEKKKIEKVARKYCYDASVKPYLESVGIEEWETICAQIPGIIERRGRKATYSPLDLLNAILYLERTRSSIRKLPLHFPRWRAVESQKRRWCKSGIFDAIIDLRKAKYIN